MNMIVVIFNTPSKYALYEANTAEQLEKVVYEMYKSCTKDQLDIDQFKELQDAMSYMTNDMPGNYPAARLAFDKVRECIYATAPGKTEIVFTRTTSL